MKKIVILTMKPLLNYGGILQAFALQKYLTSLGYDAYTTYPTDQPLLSMVAINMKRFIRSLTLKTAYISVDEENNMIGRNTSEYVKNYIRLVDFKKCVQKKPGYWGALIVGSDQVWRSAYVNVRPYLFDFAKNTDVLRVSYAASFGRDDMTEYSTRLLGYTKELAGRFDAMSVREKSGIQLAEQYWEVRASQHIDPTMLIDKEIYDKQISTAGMRLKKLKDHVFVYILDRNDTNKRICRAIENLLNVQSYEILPERPISRKHFASNTSRYALPPVEQWLIGVRDAEYIVTDSFHGVVFSILYNKPFVVIANKLRGLSRLTSLLELFGLEDRLITSKEQIDETLINRQIDWAEVNAILDSERRRSHRYLIANLKSVNS